MYYYQLISGSLDQDRICMELVIETIKILLSGSQLILQIAIGLDGINKYTYYYQWIQSIDFAKGNIYPEVLNAITTAKSQYLDYQ